MAEDAWCEALRTAYKQAHERSTLPMCVSTQTISYRGYAIEPWSAIQWRISVNGNTGHLAPSLQAAIAWVDGVCDMRQVSHP